MNDDVKEQIKHIMAGQYYYHSEETKDENIDAILALTEIAEGLKRLEVESQCTLCTPDRYLDVPKKESIEELIHRIETSDPAEIAGEIMGLGGRVFMLEENEAMIKKLNDQGKGLHPTIKLVRDCPECKQEREEKQYGRNINCRCKGTGVETRPLNVLEDITILPDGTWELTAKCKAEGWRIDEKKTR